MSDIGNGRTGRSDVVMSAAAAQPDAGRTAGVNANVVLAIVAVAQFMVVLDASIVQCALPTIRRATSRASSPSAAVCASALHARRGRAAIF
jgi:hypothetical protein